MSELIWYLVFINLIAVVIYGLDKILAIKKMFRISERFLFLISFLGGGLGCVIGMNLFRHKSRKFKFWVWNIFMISVWIYIIVLSVV